MTVTTTYNYQMPTEMVKKAGQSFVVSFALGSLFTGNIAAGVAIGALAALTNLVSNASKPLFRKIWDEAPAENWWQRAIRHVVVLSIVGATIAPLLGVGVAVVASLVLTVASDIFLRNMKDLPWYVSDWTIMA